MEKHTVHAYLIECLSNLHVGSGDNNYGVIDKQVQRDTISHEPVIHASSLKGAIREYFECLWNRNDDRITTLFGSDKDSKEKDNPTENTSVEEKGGETDKKNTKKVEGTQGALRFFEARLLSIPVRGTGAEPYYLASTDDLIKNFNNATKTFNLGINIAVGGNSTNAETEYGSFPLFQNVALLGNPVSILDKDNFKELLTHLPVIARNQLENGQSQNLWYEEVVPRQSRFYFFVAVPNILAGVNYEIDFNDKLNNVIQIGANSTVGYGYCKISRISKTITI